MLIADPQLPEPTMQTLSRGFEATVLGEEDDVAMHMMDKRKIPFKKKAIQ